MGINHLRKIRQREGVSIRSMARQLGQNIPDTRQQEDPNNDIRISDLQRWQQVLEVPVGELLGAEDTRCSEHEQRALLTLIMKDVRTLSESVTGENNQRILGNLITRLKGFMPELDGVGAWHSVGQRKSLNELGRVAEHVYRDPAIGRYNSHFVPDKEY